MTRISKAATSDFIHDPGGGTLFLTGGHFSMENDPGGEFSMEK